MATILVKGLPEQTLKELRRLKVELNCRTWAELLEKLAGEPKGQLVVVDKDELERMKEGVEGFLKLRKEVSKKWFGPPTVLTEMRRSRHHHDERG